MRNSDQMAIGKTRPTLTSSSGNHDKGYEKRLGYNILADSGLADRCDDINECLIDTDLCHANGVCTNTDGSFQCGCGIGFQGQNFEIKL